MKFTNKVDIGVILFIIGFVTLLFSTTFSENIESGNYSFEFNIGENSEYVYLNCFSLNYDFDSNLGSILFNTDGGKFDYMLVDLNFVINSITVDNETNHVIWKNVSNKYYSQIILNNISNKDGVIIHFTSNLKPNAYFQIYSNTDKITIHGSCTPNVIFKLGNHYNCEEECLYPIKGITERLFSSSKIIQINFNPEDIDNHQFKIRASDNYTRMYRDFLFGLGVSIIASAIVIYFESRLKNKSGIKYRDNSSTRSKKKK
ncbi:MAG: hypothetical protein PHU12_02255 [Candidatus Aenigmarchaeota archaeon]|nr:hypothetical protein [Candidatus Aenigmarchaeota archaeon]